MNSTRAKVSLVGVLTLGLVLGSLMTPAGAERRKAVAFRTTQGEEVVGGTYHCGGSVYTDDQTPNIDAYAWLHATSGITSGYYGTGQNNHEAPADLDAMAQICLTHVSEVTEMVPNICTVGPISSRRSEWGNGAGASSTFDFSCQGTRDEVMDVIGGFGRIALTHRLP